MDHPQCRAHARNIHRWGFVCTGWIPIDQRVLARAGFATSSSRVLAAKTESIHVSGDNFSEERMRSSLESRQSKLDSNGSTLPMKLLRGPLLCLSTRQTPRQVPATELRTVPSRREIDFHEPSITLHSNAAFHLTKDMT